MAPGKIVCPICRNGAKKGSAATGDYLAVDCTSCGRFQASESFRESAKAQSIAARRHALELARLRAPYGAMPHVTTYDIP